LNLADGWLAPYGALVTRVEDVKSTQMKNFVIVNTDMHQMPKPIFYWAFHEIKPLSVLPGSPLKMYDIVGPNCESSHVPGRSRVLPEVFEGDLLAILNTAAYGFVMASQYNLHELPNEYFIGQFN